MIFRRVFVVVAVVCLAALSAIGQKVEKGVAAPDNIPAALKAAVQSDGVRVLNAGGAAYEEIWLRKDLSAEAKEATGDIAYPGIPEGSFLGVWRYVTAGSDFRGQSVKPGVYSMRQALMPPDGNHMGAWPNRDFILLIPADADKDPAANLKYDEVVALSRKATGTNHPAIYPMQPPEAAGDATLSKNDRDQGILTVKMPTRSGGAMPVAFIVFGRGEQ